VDLNLVNFCCQVLHNCFIYVGRVAAGADRQLSQSLPHLRMRAVVIHPISIF
jgi:hypothetical protein